MRWLAVGQCLLFAIFATASLSAADDVKGFVESPFADSFAEEDAPPPAPPLERAPDASNEQYLAQPTENANWIQPEGCGNVCASANQGCCNNYDGGGSCCNSCCNNCCYGDLQPKRLLPQCGPVQIYGWLDGGYMGNPTSPNSRWNGPYNAVDRSELMGNQAYLVAERSVRDSDCMDIGGRVDALYGFDFILAQSIGVEVNPDGSNRWNRSQFYGLAIPQAYVELGHKEMSLKVGHFYSVVGYEGVTAPTNFFYSKAYSYQFAEPFTHWGALANWQPSDNWQVQVGPHMGWNTLDGQQDRVSAIGSIKYTSDCQDWWSSFAITTGEENNNPGGLTARPNLVRGRNQYDNRTRYSFIVDKQYCCWEYLFHHWLGVQENGAPGVGNAMWYGIDQYLYYRWNACHRFGVRVEWFRDEQGTRVGLNRPGNPNKPPLRGSYYSVSAGWNWTPHSNLIVRPEIRWDTQVGPGRPYDNGLKDYQVMLGLDTIVLF